MGGFEVIEILLEGGIVELREEFLLGRCVEAADVVDELTFVHGVFTFRLARETFLPGGTCENCPDAGARVE